LLAMFLVAVKHRTLKSADMVKSDGNIRVGLRIDVDTFRGTREGVPYLLKLFAEEAIRGSFFFTLGPDNMGRHLWRLLKPAFLLKMWRSRAASLYGWNILLCGVFWPGPLIGKRLATIIQDTFGAGHETGLHAWDHQRWQAWAEHMPRKEFARQLRLGVEALMTILKGDVICSAVAGWKCTDDILLEKETYCFDYNSDCRGTSLFRPLINGRVCIPQIPVTLPTYDEVIGREGITDANYNAYLLSQIKTEGLNVLTIHAEVEGLARREIFQDFLRQSKKMAIEFVPLGELLSHGGETIPLGSIVSKPIPGREGNVCWQSPCAIRP